MKGVIYQYKIANKYYVGKTYGLERKRIDKHKYEALTKKSDTPFCRAIRKYGWDEVRKSYSVIEQIEALTIEELNKKLIEREAFWISERKAVVPLGYNVCARGTEIIPHTENKEEIYSKVSESLKGKYMNASYSSKKVYCIEQDKWYPSISEAERMNHLSRGCIGKAASGNNCHAGGLTWSFDGNIPCRKDKIKQSRKTVICIETGEIFESTYALAKILWGTDAMKKKCRIWSAIKNGWAVDGLHYKHFEHDNPVLIER